MAFIDDLFGPASRASIGDVQLSASIQEVHSLAGTITEFAVESGQDITDHYRKAPDTVEIHGVVTDTPISDSPIPGATFVDSIVARVRGDEAPSLAAYRVLESYFEGTKTLTILTKFKAYTDMVLTSLVVDKTASTANAIYFDARAQRVRFASTATGVAISKPKKPKSTLGQESKNTGQAGTSKANAAQERSLGHILFR